ncbi:uncharacterized protein JN550_010243 [Neoarthrinium moseri]|uniref:uncharacterized protein n=1 Tax=Neoarthrinium moseri TaxID=1658444 RepID=UPI001FDB4B39|nr:uncharacterized protein JN550_010243 [Neoarthrinium moseri]KAI1862381.1 hypothetical protein JN550_010243 [Neoarthrinium moseri]
MVASSQAVSHTSLPTPNLGVSKGAQISAPLTLSQLAIVKSTAPILKENGEKITSLFYGNMIEHHPELHHIFNQTGQVTGAQPRALAGAVFAYASYVDDLGKLQTLVERIAHKHVSLTIQPEQYSIVGKYLIEAVATVLGDAVTPEVADAWTAAYAALADIFIKREKQLYDSHKDWTGWRRFKIQKKVEESSEITSFYLVAEDGQPLPNFKPGQYISLHVSIPEFGYMQPRQYSLSDAPHGDYYRISVKKESGRDLGPRGWVSNVLHENYKEGDVVELTHPTGEFFVDPVTDDTAPIVLLSAGVGVTPMISILNSLVATHSNRPISWIHGTRSSELQAFKEHIQSTCNKSPNLTSTVFNSHVTKTDVKGVDYQFDGRMDLKKLHQSSVLFLDNRRTQYYVCGPTNFMNDVRRYLITDGVTSERVHVEVFGVGDGE